MLLRRASVESVGGFDPELRQSQDVDLMLRLSLAGCEFEWHRESTMCYRHHAESTIRSNGLAQVKYARLVLDKFFANPLVPRSIERKKRSVRYYSELWLAWHLLRVGNLDQVVPQLQQTRQYSHSKFYRIAHDWLYSLTEWSANAQLDIGTVRDLIPAIAASDSGTPGSSQELAASLEWWLDVWWRYVQSSNDSTFDRSDLKPDVSPQELFSRISFHIRTAIRPASVESVDRFLKDARSAGLWDTKDRHGAIAPYVALAGRSMYSFEFATTSQSIVRILQRVWHPKAWWPTLIAIKNLLAELCSPRF